MAAKLVAMGSSIVAVGLLLRGHDVLTGVAVSLLFLWAMATVVFGILYRRRGPGLSGGGLPPSPGPTPVVPSRPPGAPPEVYCEHAG